MSRPPDFGRFWSLTTHLLSQIDPVPGVAEAHATEHPGLWLTRFGFRSLGDASISAYLLAFDDARPRPLVVHAHGYDAAGARVEWDWARAGLHVAGVDIRGFGRSQSAVPAASSWGYVLTGIEAPERSVLRGAVCDLVRTAQVAHDMLGRKVSRVVLNGMSFGGALAVMAAAVGHQPNLLAVGVPTLGWAEGRNLLVRQGSGAEISRFAERRPESREDAMVTLRYFDAVNFADLIRAPTLVGVGLVDPVVPPSTVYAIANHLAGPREVMELPVSHTDRPEESEWKRFERRWIALALEEKELSLGGRIAWTS